ncbi:hypothetical protein BMS3Bbin02_01192 [bacterium BMS3Bbin02]|nr:hypothetical protein BMS3Bbin02_01192 [bacterium BMS3Bbin02]
MSPGFGVVSSTVFVIATSVRGTLIVALAESLVGSTSIWSTDATVAMLVIAVPAVPASTVTTSVNVAAPATPRGPTVHMDPT